MMLLMKRKLQQSKYKLNMKHESHVRVIAQLDFRKDSEFISGK